MTTLNLKAQILVVILVACAHPGLGDSSTSSSSSSSWHAQAKGSSSLPRHSPPPTLSSSASLLRPSPPIICVTCRPGTLSSKELSQFRGGDASEDGKASILSSVFNLGTATSFGLNMNAAAAPGLVRFLSHNPTTIVSFACR